MAFELLDKSRGAEAAQRLLSEHLARAHEVQAKNGDATGPGYVQGSPVKVDEDSEFRETGGLGEFRQAVEDPGNGPFFGGFIARMRDFKYNTGDEDFG